MTINRPNITYLMLSMRGTHLKVLNVISHAGDLA